MWGAGEQGKFYPRTGWSWDNLTASRCVTRAVKEVGGVPEWEGPEHETGLLTKGGGGAQANAGETICWQIKGSGWKQKVRSEGWSMKEQNRSLRGAG